MGEVVNGSGGQSEVGEDLQVGGECGEGGHFALQDGEQPLGAAGFGGGVLVEQLFDARGVGFGFGLVGVASLFAELLSSLFSAVSGEPRLLGEA